mmetsp:Transcript_38490/g.43716  ORF Transcript_38490/g.43716 Transcript_38490/m.43716 type:complete len:91 (+) Transcript_38490:688-960(+)
MSNEPGAKGAKLRYADGRTRHLLDMVLNSSEVRSKHRHSPVGWTLYTPFAPRNILEDAQVRETVIAFSLIKSLQKLKLSGTRRSSFYESS